MTDKKQAEFNKGFNEGLEAAGNIAAVVVPAEQTALFMKMHEKLESIKKDAV